MQRSKAKQISQDEILMQQYNINSLSQMNEDFFKENGRYQSYFIQTFGCQMNEHDSENLAGMFDMMNIDLADSMEEADIIIFNTCAVRENAELKVYGNLHALKKLKVKNPDLELFNNLKFKIKFLMKGGVKMLEHKENKELTEAEVNAYDLVIICYGKLRKDCLTDCLDGTYWLSPEQ